MRETQVRSLGWEDPLEKELATKGRKEVLLPGKPHERRSLMDYSPWGREESDTTERLQFASFYPKKIKPVRILIGLMLHL